ncbi:hypothetical protein [Entomobacter blattae]|uniref:Uncharacterized protein n=1 Tax=Entomobacter blattae TaxID=2762277 RepID=A0A7H1NUE0_9PROT|nr:hypothetical protein [Entomobacter blattae]QNT79400.1 hypothetical protein JGUZn3_21990 [Entomobacter blattae]
MTLNRRVTPEILLKQRKVLAAQQQFMAQLRCYGATDMANSMQKQIQASNTLLEQSYNQRAIAPQRSPITLNGKPIPQLRMG